MVAESDLSHDYAEIYTPNREKIDWEASGKPPTPPLHRFPSWESRIYQVANEGLSNSLPGHTDKHFRNVARAGPYMASSGYCDISCPVYATVKGVSNLRVRSIEQIDNLVLTRAFDCREQVKFDQVLSAATRPMIHQMVKTIKVILLSTQEQLIVVLIIQVN